MYRVVVLEPLDYPDSAITMLSSFANVSLGPFAREELIEEIKNTDILITRLAHFLDKELIDLAPELKIIATATTGLNHIDTEYCARKNITVLSLKDETDFLETLTATAEMTWALLLALIRKIPSSFSHVKLGGWDRDKFRSQQLKGKILGIVGYGRLGKIVANFGQTFGMKVLICDPYIDEFPEWIENVSLSNLLISSDVISLHLPLEKETEKMFSFQQFGLIKEGAVIINTSRGEIIDELALLDALEKNRLGGAGLDVLSGEYQDAGSKTALLEYARENENLIITPHIGGATRESMYDAEMFMVRKLERYLDLDRERK